MSLLVDIELRDDLSAREYVKDELVAVTFATAPGVVASREGGNRYDTGDALITGSTGDRWSVSRSRFDAKYIPEPGVTHGQDGRYRSRLIPVLAKQMSHAFSLARSKGGDLIYGRAGDWLMQYAPGDFGIVEEAKFAKVYRVR